MKKLEVESNRRRSNEVISELNITRENKDLEAAIWKMHELRMQ